MPREPECGWFRSARRAAPRTETRPDAAWPGSATPAASCKRDRLRLPFPLLRQTLDSSCISRVYCKNPIGQFEMCGIVGFLDKTDGAQGKLGDVILGMLDALECRG